MKKETHTSKAIGKSHHLQSLKERLTKLGWKESDGGMSISKSTLEKKGIKPLPDGTSPFAPMDEEDVEKFRNKLAKKKRIPDWDKEWHREKEKRLFDFDVHEVPGMEMPPLPKEIDLSEAVNFGSAFKECMSLSSFPKIDFGDGKSEP
jgi:hypothetical protein